MVFVILRLAVLVQLRLLADRHRQTDRGPWLVPRDAIVISYCKLCLLYGTEAVALNATHSMLCVQYSILQVTTSALFVM